MSDQDITYQKALETLGNRYAEVKGLCDPQEVNMSSDKILNNCIIELLIQLNRKLDMIRLTSPVKETIGKTELDQLNKTLNNLIISSGKKVVTDTKTPFLVWKDPREQIEEYRRKQNF